MTSVPLKQHSITIIEKNVEAEINVFLCLNKL